MTRKPSLWSGAFIGALLTAPLLVIMALGQQLAGLPFLPSDFFNPVRDLTPGALLELVKQAMIDAIIGADVGRLDIVAKQVETAMAIGMVFSVGVVSGIIFFAIFNRLERRMLPTAGALGGLIVGVPMALISFTAGTSSTVDPRILGSIWLVALFLIWGIVHAWAYGRLVSSSTDRPVVEASAVANPERRQFLVTVGAASATVTVLGSAISSFLQPRDTASSAVASAGGSQAASELPADLPNANDPVIPAPGTRAEITPVSQHYRIDISLIPPTVDEASWVLPFFTSLNGSQETLATFTLDQIKGYEPVEAYITMSCISNRVAGDLISTTKWTGVPFHRLLEDVPLPENATHFKITSADGFDETVAIDLIRSDERIMLAYYWEDQPLTTEHGFPLRIHIPGLYGMKQPKWITGIEAIQGDIDGYWVRRGWDKEARVRATSVIDTVAVDAAIEADGQTLIPIGGIAWAADRGISAVEVQVDGGEWQPARLRTPVSDRTWTLWRFDWPFIEGDHTFAVRCQEGDGSPQIEAVAGVRPAGATGIHSVREDGLTISGTPAPFPGAS